MAVCRVYRILEFPDFGDWLVGVLVVVLVRRPHLLALPQITGEGTGGNI